MGTAKSEQHLDSVLDPILGYLNFSNGNHDTVFFKNLNSLFQILAESESGESPALYHQVGKRLLSRLEVVSRENSTFRDSRQSRQILEFVFHHFLESYRRYHRDLLFHQQDSEIFNAFFLGRVFEKSLCIDGDLEKREEFSRKLLSELNDYLGHRPVPTLEEQKTEAYAHEWIGPVPIYLQGAGVAYGKYQTVVQKALELVTGTDPAILRAAQFNLDKLTELAFDPRAFDFDHPINQRPNHHFGQWDEHLIDGEGYFCRFIIHQVTVDALLARAASPESPTGQQISEAEAMLEAAAVLAGTILMASGISGERPSSFDSNTQISDLLPVIASYRDQFYQDLLTRIPAEHASRLRREAELKRQPFGEVRQNLNAQLAQRRASQLVNCRLASIFARMGYPEAAEEQSKIVPVASARITCQIDCLLSASTKAIQSNDLDDAFSKIPKIMSRLKRGIHCGAIVDPWNILGFDANYSLFPALENTVKDHRVYDLVDLMERIFALFSRLWSEAAASSRAELCELVRNEFRSVVDWWHKFAVHSQQSVEAVNPEDIYQAAELVASALNLWHRGGAATGDINFWRQHANLFGSPKAYSLVVDALMQRADYKTSMALLIHWLSQAESILLQQGDSSFHDLVFRWMADQKKLLRNRDSDSAVSPDLVWERIRKFYDFIEANAEAYWEVPTFQLDLGTRNSRQKPNSPLDDLESDIPDDESPIFDAAYDDVVYVDSTDDGRNSDTAGNEPDTDEDSLSYEVARVIDRLEFLSTLAGYWGIAATVPLPVNRAEEVNEEINSLLLKRRDIIINWIGQAVRNREQLLTLLTSINSYHLKVNGSDHESLQKYDQQRTAKDTLLERAISTSIETENGIRRLAAVVQAVDCLLGPVEGPVENQMLGELEESLNCGISVVNVYSAVLLQDPALVCHHLEALTDCLVELPILYVPLAKGGDPAAIVRTRVVQTAILDLLQRLPTLGLFEETYKLTSLALAMERRNPVGRGAVTEFDEIFEVAYTSMVRTLVRSTSELKHQRQDEGHTKQQIKEECQTVLFECIEMLTESMLMLWLEHSKTLRLSVVEKIQEKQSWDKLVEFITRYGSGFFYTAFFTSGEHSIHTAPGSRELAGKGRKRWTA